MADSTNTISSMQSQGPKVPFLRAVRSKPPAGEHEDGEEPEPPQPPAGDPEEEELEGEDDQHDGEGDLADPATEALVKLLAAALRTNTSLLALDLSESGLGVEGCTILASALKLNSTLTKLDLTRNNIGEEGATAIADVLMSANSAITDLYVGGNDLSDSARQCLEDACKGGNGKKCGLRL